MLGGGWPRRGGRGVDCWEEECRAERRLVGEDMVCDDYLTEEIPLGGIESEAVGNWVRGGGGGGGGEERAGGRSGVKEKAPCCRVLSRAKWTVKCAVAAYSWTRM